MQIILNCEAVKAANAIRQGRIFAELGDVNSITNSKKGQKLTVESAFKLMDLHKISANLHIFKSNQYTLAMLVYILVFQ